MNQTTPSTALDVLHHQHAEGGRVLPLGHSFGDPCWNVNMHDMANQIQAREVIRNLHSLDGMNINKNRKEIKMVHPGITVVSCLDLHGSLPVPSMTHN